jgi:O-antigen biosynthesis protein WbqP
MDIVLALVAFPFVLAVVLPLVIIIRLESRGPAFFRQSRVGRDEAIFTLVKLRTMYESTPDIPSHEAIGAMITPLGRILRKMKLDELPQIWNVLIGQMSFVGPRPCLETQEELINARRDLDVFSVRPGITGLAQVTGVDMSSPQKLAQTDRDYIGTMSLTTDVKLIIATVSGRGYGDAIF